MIQAGRDEQLVEKDLISAPESVLFKHAVLDVFATEPLPKEHVFWQRTDITITPHNAARSDIEQTARELLYQYNL